MDAFGFYQIPEDGALDIIQFLASNLIGVCKELCPKNIPQVFFVDENSMKPQSIISYSPDCDIFILCPEKVLREYKPLMDNIPWLFLELWETVFHEVRHFVQHQYFAEHERQSALLTEQVLEEIDRRDHEAAQAAYNHIEVYASLRDEDEDRWEQEFDAIIVGIIAIGILAACCDGHSFNFDTIKVPLLYSMHCYRENPLSLNTFFTTRTG